MECDFCSSTAVAWRYPADSFIANDWGNWVSESVGDWAACRECYELIEANNKAGLLARSMKTFYDRYHLYNAGAEAFVRRAQERFFAHRVGPAVKIR